MSVDVNDDDDDDDDCFNFDEENLVFFSKRK